MSKGAPECSSSDVTNYASLIANGMKFSNEDGSISSVNTGDDETSPYYMAVNHVKSGEDKMAIAEKKSKDEDKLVEEICDTDIERIGDMNLVQTMSEVELMDNTWDTMVGMESMTQNLVDKGKDQVLAKKKADEDRAKEEKTKSEKDAEEKAIREARDEVLKQENIDNTAL